MCLRLLVRNILLIENWCLLQNLYMWELYFFSAGGKIQPKYMSHNFLSKTQDTISMQKTLKKAVSELNKSEMSYTEFSHILFYTTCPSSSRSSMGLLHRF